MLNMMRKKNPFRWQDEGKRDFKDIKTAISNAPMLVNQDFKKYFIIYHYTLEHTLFGILTMRNDQDEEAPIAFMSIPLKKYELKTLKWRNMCLLR